MYKLKTIGSPYTQYNLKTGAYRLGSATDSELLLEDSSVSPYHCEVLVTSIITIRDISPSHETYIDEEKIETAPFRIGQVLRLGNVRLELEETDPKAAADKSADGKLGATKAAANEKRARLYENVGIPLLILGGFAGLMALIYYLGLAPDTTNSENSKSKPAKAAKADPPAEKPPPEPDPPPESTPKTNAASAATKGVSVTATNAAARRAPRNLQHRSSNVSRRMFGAPAERFIGNPIDPLAGPLLEQTLERQKQALAPDHPEVTQALNKLGRHYQETGQFDKAEPLLEKALENVQKTRGQSHPETAAALDTLGSLHADSGNLTQAESMVEQALSIRERTLPLSHPDIGASLNTLAAIRAAQGDITNATPLMERALKVYAASLNLDHPAIRDTLSALSDLHDAQGNATNAERFAQTALKTAEQALGSDHPETASMMNKLAGHYSRRGNPAEAAPLFQRAAETSEKLLGLGHPQTEDHLHELAQENLCQGDPEKSREVARKALASKQELLAAMILCGSEQQLLSYRERLTPYTLSAFGQSIPELASSILQYKGVMLDALLEERALNRASRRPVSMDVADQLRAKKAELAHLLFELPADPAGESVEQRQTDRTALTERIQKLESELSAYVPGLGRARRALEIKASGFQGSLMGGSALLEFVRYSRCLGSGRWEPHYGVMILAPGVEPAWIGLGSAAAIEETLGRFRAQLQKGVESSAPAATNGTAAAAAPEKAQGTSPAAASTTGEEPLLGELLNTLHKQLWEPIQSKLPAGTRQVIISPDAALNLLVFGVLRNAGGEFLCTQYSIRYVSAGRDLLAARKSPRSGPALILATPRFADSNNRSSENFEAAGIAIRDSDRGDLLTVQLPQFAASVEEAARVELLFRKLEQPVTSLYAAKASEWQLAQAEAPRILHLATCGLFLPKSRYDSEMEEHRSGQSFASLTSTEGSLRQGVVAGAGRLFAGTSPLSNPLHRSAVVLAGAAVTFQAWSQDQSPPTANDGIVTADEISALHLSETALVSLSTSDFGQDSMRSGEAVLALRRAFLQAGAENLLILLRSAPEEETDLILLDFYEKFLMEGDAPRALAEVQRDWLIRLEKERGLGSALRLAGPFILSSQGSLP